MMPLFGGASPRTMQAYATLLQDKPPVTPETLTPRRRGLFGGGLTPDRMMILGAALRDAGAGGRTDHLAQTMAMQAERPLNDMRIRGAKMEMGEAESAQQQRQQQRQMIEQYVAPLPVEQQAQARVAAALDPEGFVERMQGGEWQGGQGYTHAWRTRPDGSVQLGGELPLRPYAPRSSSSTQSYSGLPPGFDLD